MARFTKTPGFWTSCLTSAFILSACISPNTLAQTETITPASQGEVSSWTYGLPAYANKVTDGGRGGQIVKVTSLASEGPGTLREALSTSGPKIIVFEVGGVIDLQGNNIGINTSDITIAGQTAPSPGITLVRGGFVIRGQDLIIQHLRIRPGDLNEAKRSGRDINALTTLGGAANVVVDHCSLSWATDENLSASSTRLQGDSIDEWRQNASHSILYSNNIIAEGLSDSTHAKGEHSKGSLIHDHVNDIVIYRNLYSSNYERSPLFKGDVQGAIVNNVIYNPGQRAIHYNLQSIEWEGHEPQIGKMDLVSNVMRYGPSTQPGLPMVMIGGIGDLDLYDRDNIAVDRWGQPAPTRGSYETGPAKINEVNKATQDLTGLEILNAEFVEDSVLKNAGARPWDRDTNDVRVLADAAEGRGSIIDSQEEVGGYPEFAATTSTFDPGEWDLSTMSPKTANALDNGNKARGT